MFKNRIKISPDLHKFNLEFLKNIFLIISLLSKIRIPPYDKLWLGGGGGESHRDYKIIEWASRKKCRISRGTN